MKKLCLGGLLLATLLSPLWARLSLSLYYPDLAYDNLKPGTTTRLQDLGAPDFKVKNNSDKTITILVEPLVRPFDLLKEGYESRPAISWIKAVPREFKLKPGQTGVSQIHLAVPQDPQLAGRHFQVKLRVKSVNKGMISAAVASLLELSIGTPRPQGKRNTLQLTMGEKMNLFPNHVRLKNFSLNKKKALKRQKVRTFKITNQSPKKVKVTLTSVPPDKKFIPFGHHPVPNPKWLTIKGRAKKINPNKSHQAELFLKIPRQKEKMWKKYVLQLNITIEKNRKKQIKKLPIYFSTEPQ